MKKRIVLICAIALISILLMTGCSSINGLIQQSLGKDVTIDLYSLQTSNVGSVVANNIVKQCVKVQVTFKTGQVAQGAGFVITSNGYVVTNRHVCIMYQSGKDYPSTINEKPLEIEKIQVSFANSPTIAYPASLIDYSTDKGKDIAVLQIDGFQLPQGTNPIKFDLVNKVYYGQDVYTFGNPEGLGLLFTHLNISSYDHSFNSKTSDGQEINYTNIIFLDGNVNHGNSGGVLVNSLGNAVGLIYGRIESSKKTTNDVYGIGCALPISDVKDFIDKSILLKNRVDYVLETKTVDAQK